MKELSIEQKAKAYDEAIERARTLKENPESVFYEYSPKEGDTISDYIFPELREGEDEKIRKEIIYHIQHCDDTIDEETEKRMIAWLEKQKKVSNYGLQKEI